jgi:hypothetical protein
MTTMETVLPCSTPATFLFRSATTLVPAQRKRRAVDWPGLTFCALVGLGGLLSAWLWIGTLAVHDLPAKPAHALFLPAARSLP